ncbi:MAG: hypothetical protein FJ117_02300 [Deltaproteobacteria bacterium]|nr:hypothetical protein [Deltaproteobacteria bacterium]
MKGAERIEIDRRYCKGCLLCQYVCKYEVFEPGQERSALDYLMPRPAKLENCRVCLLCQTHCPDMALVVVAGKNLTAESAKNAEKNDSNSKIAHKKIVTL